MKLGLEALEALCLRLDRPERRFPSVLVGGTNGKGSTAATLASIAAACGVRAGLYTSPHLVRVTERIRIEEKDVLEEELDRALARVFAAADAAPAIPATYFEASTAAAFLLFAERPLDLAILEVGLGGRFDATNVAPAVLSAVTSSGSTTCRTRDTLGRIARESRHLPPRGARRPRGRRPRGPGDPRGGRGNGADWHDASVELTVRLRDGGQAHGSARERRGGRSRRDAARAAPA
jgi:hypothetical protein